MIGRRGRFVTVGMAGYLYVYFRVRRAPSSDFLFLGLQESLFDALVFSWLMLATYYSDGFLGRVAYGAQSRIMDGVLARANCLVIMTLRSVFKFIMVPLGFQLAGVFPPSTYGAVYALVWLSYLGSDGLSEIVGQLLGKQKLRVWGIGEVNRKSVAGTWACFLGSLVIGLSLVYANGLGLAWVGLVIVISLSNTFFELLSPRGTDDFTMASANAVLCWGFGRFVL
jgi:dolichol kinase